MLKTLFSSFFFACCTVLSYYVLCLAQGTVDLIDGTIVSADQIIEAARQHSEGFHLIRIVLAVTIVDGSRWLFRR